MDLALELGFRTVEELRGEMTERELGQWYRYARRRLLPSQRIEIALGNIARLTAGSDSISAFLFDPNLRDLLSARPVETAESGVAAISSIVGGAQVIRLGVNKRKRNA